MTQPLDAMAMYVGYLTAGIFATGRGLSLETVLRPDGDSLFVCLRDPEAGSKVSRWHHLRFLALASPEHIRGIAHWDAETLLTQLAAVPAARRRAHLHPDGAAPGHTQTMTGISEPEPVPLARIFPARPGLPGPGLKPR